MFCTETRNTRTYDNGKIIALFTCNCKKFKEFKIQQLKDQGRYYDEQHR